MKFVKQILCLFALIAGLPIWVYLSVNFVYWLADAPEQVSEQFGGAVLFYSMMAYALLIIGIVEVKKRRKGSRK